MKTLLTFLILLTSAAIVAQSDKVAGNYALSLPSNEGDVIEYKLTLNEDGSFVFHYYLNINHRIPSTLNQYGKGTWTVKDNVVVFSSDKQKDIDEKNMVDFTATKARFLTKSHRAPSDKLVKTQLRFLKSAIPFMERVDLVKI
ncbi:copper resistance protein NlpE N-terminal domain-containing protein [Flavobacterium sp.]|uniref:copper resistance protein NlpE N-terminal domain-containing protein n=1 Tax=Flavobacterium sp. TaxID=239 RepID=UPI002489F274|nr:copper resistance protein NlpE N-terminal domain-containing protein [Flavobacterium sp.]MDI1317260.1 copper resistance protein NlpE N-terminal domain-containing protein [Flavobacterium sp.]